ncbi:putative leucine-rich repeat receptor-like protein kinase [Hibiscus syriacus]|uniref:non-specific serine/threonine protein kinase n=1 Tax=Hibiscus syriacus TaxID=106335 RepID=A0A6A2XPI0_HIBSY|nr:putative leucine-rich repeat receptor-like protein kinase [Hibiscus syriacus]
MSQLKLFDSFLAGNIPQQLGVHSQIWVVDFSDNRLTGRIQLYFCQRSNLILLNLGANNLHGDIPTGIKNCKTLVQLRLAGNRLNSTFPSELCNLVNLSAIELGQNNFTGPFPSEIGNCGKLQRLHIAENQFSSDSTYIYFHPKEGFTFQDLIEATNYFDESYVVGSGACGTVYKAVMNSGQTIAVKRLASNAEGDNIEDSFRAEILTLGKIRHWNIVKLYGFCYHQGSNLLLSEYMEKGSSGEMLHGSSCSLKWSTRFMIALEAAEGLSYLHHDCKPKIVHRDIKSNNILLDEKFEAHVGDLGLAKVIDMPQSKSMSAIAGSYGYIAPVCIYCMKVTEKCDIYNYGDVLLELLTGKTPVQPLDRGGDLNTRVQHYVRDHSFDAGILDDCLNLNDKSVVHHMITVLKIALRCTSMSPTDRPSMSKSRGHEDNSATSPPHESE